MIVQKTASMNLRVDPMVKSNAEEVLSQLGLSMSTAVDLFLRQVVRTGSIPFQITLVPVPRGLDVGAMTADELWGTIAAGVTDVEDNGTIDATEAFDQFRASHEFR